ncbi:MAG: peptidylprolyl isomerase FKBP-type [Proteobacteria bacterium]|nr:peptidylprolyl isomerase FKBP-type [Pseudomonadota bacterium]
MRVGILPTSLVTLNFRVSHATSGRVMFSTFEATPMTLQMGSGDLMPALETRLLGLSDGARETLQFAAGEAFGPYSEALVERVERRHIPATLQLEQDTVYSFPAPDGSSYPGLVRELTDEYALIDFNHPLAGQAVTVEVEIIGVI